MNFLEFLKLSVLSFVFTLSVSQPIFAKQLTKNQLLEMGGQTMSGVVTKVGVYNFYVKVADGEELNIHTDVSTTRFVPEDERLMIGDEINFLYFSPESASLSTDKKLAQYIEFINKVPREFLTDEMECVISVSQRNEKACYLPQYHKTVSFEGKWPGNPSQDREIRTTLGSKIRIKLKVVPANIGNGYVYIVKYIKPFK